MFTNTKKLPKSISNFVVKCFVTIVNEIVHLNK